MAPANNPWEGPDMSISWLPSIPFETEQSRAGFSGPSGALTITKMDAGLPKRRRTSTAAPRALPMSITFLTIEQIAEFETWFEVSTLTGALSFEAVHPHKGGLSLFSFADDPAYEVVRLPSDLFTLSFNLWELPS